MAYKYSASLVPRSSLQTTLKNYPAKHQNEKFMPIFWSQPGNPKSRLQST